MIFFLDIIPLKSPGIVKSHKIFCAFLIPNAASNVYYENTPKAFAVFENTLKIFSVRGNETILIALLYTKSSPSTLKVFKITWRTRRST